jgi:Holliday junction resolvase-like predicted endonuclease
VRSRPGAPTASAHAPVEAVTRVKQLRLRRLAAEYIFLHTCGRHQPRFDVASILGRRLTVIEGAF